MMAKVTLFQEYENTENESIEAKYLFPLNDSATVCGFEAFINDKHVIGVCKEKEQAHKEYKEAIEQGKGAYLIDQETSELFKVNIGNLPPNCKCIIKIIYITELEVQNEEIFFRLPGNISSWQLINTDKEVLQESVVSKFINKLNDKAWIKNTSFVASILMPFEIRSINSPTHALNIKKTACQAVCELDCQKTTTKNDDDDNTLIIAIRIATIHMPRMFVEDYYDAKANKYSRACMVSFYPEFDADQKSGRDSHIYFLVDCSNSMIENNLIGLAKSLSFYMLKNLPSSCFFNVVLFGTDFLELFPLASKNTQPNLNKAFNFLIKVIRAFFYFFD